MAWMALSEAQRSLENQNRTKQIYPALFVMPNSVLELESCDHVTSVVVVADSFTGRRKRSDLSRMLQMFTGTVAHGNGGVSFFTTPRQVFALRLPSTTVSFRAPTSHELRHRDGQPDAGLREVSRGQ